MNNIGYNKGQIDINLRPNCQYNPKTGDVFLPHSCDEWIIGDKENIELMIKDLQDALKKLESANL